MIQIKVIVQALSKGKDFWEADFFTKRYKKLGQYSKVKKLASISINNSLESFI